MPRKPSFRAKKVVKILAGKGGKSIGAAMREAGYSPVTADSPSKLTGSKSWQQLMDQYFPREFVAQKHKELFEAEDVVFMNHKGKIIEKRRPDHTARKNATEMAYKLRGEFAPEQLEVSKRKFGDMTNAELATVIETAKKKLLKK